jgi:hypothetical protein
MAVLRSVAKTDTFEIFRQKVNQIAQDVFSIGSGGSDLSTGNLKLGDGTREEPSLAFVSDSTLGIYKSANKTLGFVADGKKLADYSPTAFYSFRDLIIQQKILTTSGISILNNGTNYDAGSYTNIRLFGGTGDGATADITVTEFGGEITNNGSNYNEGTYTNVLLSGGSGSEAEASFIVEGIEGFISNAGTGYVPGIYSNISLTDGSGSGATANITIEGEINLSGNISIAGSGYTQGNYLNVQLINKPAQTFVVTTTANPGTPPPDNVYVIDGEIQKQLTLIRGNTYRFDISNSSNTGHPLIFRSSTDQFLSQVDYTFVSRGTPGQTGAFVDIIIKPSAATGTIKYNCQIHNGMGANISVVSGTAGSYGNGAIADITVNSSGAISAVEFISSGVDYKQNDVLQVFTGNVGGTGSGFEFTLSPIVYTGEITSVQIQSNGINYLKDDILSASTSNLGGFGSNFAFTIDNDPGVIIDFSFDSKGSGYEIGDILELPQTVSNISTNLKGRVTNVSTTLSNTSPIITVASTTGILAGMVVSQDFQNSTGFLLQGTNVLSVDSLTQITLSANPTTSGAAVLTFASSGNLTEITVSSTTGIYTGSIVTQTAGTGILATNTTVSSVDTETNIITLSQQPQQAGTATLTFVPSFGDPIDSFEYEINNLGEIETFSINEGGNGYSVLDQLSVNSSDLTQPITYSVINKQLVEVTFSSTISSTTFSVGDFLKKKDGEVITVNQISAPQVTNVSGTYTNVSSTTTGSGSGATFNVQRNSFGTVSSITVNSPGYFYSIDDTIIIPGTSVGGISPDNDIELEVSSVSNYEDLEIQYIYTSGGNITSILLDYDTIESGDLLIIPQTTSPNYEVNTTSGLQYRFFIDTGNGYELTPNLTFYVDDTYNFDLSDSSNTGHVFSFSTYRDGIWGPSLVEDVVSTLVTTSNQITVANSTGIVLGMAVTVSTGTGTLVSGTTVEGINGNTITLSSAPLSSGAVTLTFRGVEYTDGVTRSGPLLSIKVTEDTPNLYYYCGVQSAVHSNEGGKDNQEALITIDPNNPKVFGGGFLISVAQLQSSDVITGDIESGDFTAVKFIGQEAELSEASVTGILTAPTIFGNNLRATSITSTGNLGISATAVNVTANLNIGTNIQVVSSNGNITTSGVLRTNGSLDINNILTITNNIIATTAGNNILLTPPTGRVAKVNATTALTIPAGTSAQRPSGGVVENGAIRFNTDTNQYEGYSATTTSWSSLGGVRDLDGNTFIEAEAFTGANDNTLYFYNDGNNTLRVDRNYLDFYSTKKIRSANILAPLFTTWTANTPVNTGVYVKFRNNIYEVTTGGTTGGIQNPPTHTDGSVASGTAVLTYSTSAVDNLIFEEINELQVGPLGNLPLVINADLRLANNVISTDVNDVVIRPNAGKKVTIDSTTSLVIPSGDGNSRGSASRGSIRYNTSIVQFEGYDGSNWTSLGGVKDVDGNTYIIPETAPGANENILYFYNDGENTLRLSKTALTFQTISSISSNSNTLAINANLVTFDNLSASIDNSGTSTFISSTQNNLDLGLSVGLTNKHLLRLNTSGDIIINRGFGTSIENNLVVLSNELKDFELEDTKLSTADINLIKGTTNTGSTVLYSPTSAKGIKVLVSAENITTNDVEMVEFTVTDKGSDIYHSEYGNIITDNNLIVVTFDFNASNDVRINFALEDSVETGDEVNITVVKTIIKK